MRDRNFRKNKSFTILDATKSKMVKRKTGTPLLNAYDAFNKVSKKRSSVAIDAKAIREMLPEVKLVENLIIDSILSPNDLTNVEPRWRLENSRFSNSSVVSQVLDIIEDHFINSHKIKPRLKRYLKNVLFNYGSQTIVVLPESSIDHLINKDTNDTIGLESFKRKAHTELKDLGKNLGILGKGLDFSKSLKEQKRKDLGLESIFENHTSYELNPEVNSLGYCVHDNPGLLKLPEVSKTLRKVLEAERLGKIGLESYSIVSGYRSPLNGSYGSGSSTGSFTLTKPAAKAKIDALYKDKGNTYRELEKIEPQSRLERESIGHPIQYEPSAEAVIPITIPGTPDEKLGIIVLLGEDGNPLAIDSEISRWNTVASSYDSSLDTSGSDNDEQASNTIRSSFTKVYGQKNTTDKQTLGQLKELYSQLVVDDLNQRMVEGIYGQTVSISAHENIFKVMMARHLSNMSTRLLYIPSSLVTYIAFEYNDDGTGRSLTEDVKLIASYRSMVMMATVLAQIKSSINHTKLRIKLDEDDMEPDDAVRHALEEYAAYQAAMPFGNTSYHQQYSYFQQAGVSVEVDGNENYIDMKVDKEITQNRYEAPDSELSERLRKDFLSAYGVTTEHLDQILTSDTATAVKAATAIFTKNVQNYRKDFNYFMTDYTRKYVANSQPLRKSIEEIILDHKEELPPEISEFIKENDNNIKLAINDLIRELVFELPDEAVNLTEAAVQGFDSFSNFVDKWVEVNIPDTIINDLGIEIGDSSDSVVSMLQTAAKSTILRQYLQDNGLGSQFDELLFGDEDESTLDKVAANHFKSISGILLNMAKKIGEIRNEAKATMETVDVGMTEEELDNIDSSSPDTSSGDDSDPFGADDFGSGDDLEPDTEEDTEETTEETEETETEPEDTEGDDFGF